MNACPQEFEFGQFFDDDYLYFYADRLNDAVNDRETEFVHTTLGLKPGSVLLDLPCGHGRISNRLAARGVSVTGLDNAASFLDVARADAANRGVEVEYAEGDMRALPAQWRGRFDHVLVWFSSLGYFDDAGNQQCLVEMHMALRPGGTLLLDLHHRDWIIRNFQPDRVIEKGDDLLIDRSELDLVNSRTIVRRVILRRGVQKRVSYFVRLFTPTELRAALVAAGFRSVEFFGESGALTLDSRRLLVLAQR